MIIEVSGEKKFIEFTAEVSVEFKKTLSVQGKVLNFRPPLEEIVEELKSITKRVGESITLTEISESREKIYQINSGSLTIFERGIYDWV